MASGLPDYEKIIRPKYGVTVSKHVLVEATLAGFTDLLTIAGKGMIYGGVLTVFSTSTQDLGYLSVSFDFGTSIAKTFWKLDRYGLTKHGGYPLSLCKFDDVNFIYAVEISHGITFEKGFFVTYKGLGAVSTWLEFDLVYALV